MVKELIHDPIFLSIKSTDATILDKAVANDLLEHLFIIKLLVLEWPRI